MFQKPKRKVTKVFLHCSASDKMAHNDVGIIEQWHKKRGFKGVGYHYFIKKNGEIQKGRSLERTPAAQRFHNKGSIAICVHGHYNFTNVSLKALKNLCLEIKEVYHGEITFHGHKEVSAKACPVFDYIKLLDLDKKGYSQLPTIEFVDYKKLDKVPFKPVPIVYEPGPNWFERFLIAIGVKKK